MSVPSRKKAISRTKKGRSVKSLAFRRENLQRPLIVCQDCQKLKRKHFLCANCFKNNKEKS